jgi:hypothetical protein
VGQGENCAACVWWAFAKTEPNTSLRFSLDWATSGRDRYLELAPQEQQAAGSFLREL